MLDAGLDQAAGLRRLLAPRALRVHAFALARHQPAHWIAWLAIALAGLGRKPVVLDGAGGALTRCFGLRLRHELADLLQGRERFEHAAGCASGVHVLRAERGLEAFAASGQPAQQLLQAFAGLPEAFDDLLLALPPAELACFAAPGHTVPVLAAVAGRTGAVDSYAMAKQLAEGFGYRRFACVVLGAAGEAQARAEHARLAQAAQRFLQAEVAWAGWLPASGLGAPRAAAGCAQLLLATPPVATGDCTTPVTTGA